MFTNAIGGTSEERTPHLQQMYVFWSSIMLGTGTFRGNPMQKHKTLPFFLQELFEGWLRLLEERARELYTPEVAENFVQ